MRRLPLNLTVLVVSASMFSLSADSDDTQLLLEPAAVETPLPTDGDSEKVQYEAGREPVDGASVEEPLVNAKNPDAEIAKMAGEPDSASAVDGDDRDKEEVWGEISQAISGLNDMVGDQMFRDLRRTDENRMEVRVDLNFWQRVRYETRVDLKNDISNIWHLYVLQYSGEETSSVYFIDDKTNKTIDIFSQFQ